MSLTINFCVRVVNCRICNQRYSNGIRNIEVGNHTNTFHPPEGSRQIFSPSKYTRLVSEQLCIFPLRHAQNHCNIDALRKQFRSFVLKIENHHSHRDSGSIAIINVFQICIVDLLVKGGGNQPHARVRTQIFVLFVFK